MLVEFDRVIIRFALNSVLRFNTHLLEERKNKSIWYKI